MAGTKSLLTQAEENYLKEIFHLAGQEKLKVSTNALADKLDAKASSITDMLQKLKIKKLVAYQKYKGCGLTAEGERIAIQIIRKHRLWETFLVNKLNFGWDEVHDVAEQLEHIKSVKLVDGIDRLLNHPKFDPHGDPIPDKEGNIDYQESMVDLCDAAINSVVQLVSVNENSLELLKYLDEIGLNIGSEIVIHNRITFDESMIVQINKGEKISLSKKVTENLGVKFKSKL
ncbi:metal-dependent transcriptional regulator [Paracrocinitomix mangrovi]|uniref:metal-dependent transcriptional regulator n=1 Tax=Paracrocinitomix mangrovi TaxID=2862509 RepID=UPI001C8ED6ED|nr:metal-dependent transcriptional regulator [Paracrocinitomix mangrovi]UKN02892.1 metal-dependent transcriptional regulator [Paracrocinitomix mangrovi]